MAIYTHDEAARILEMFDDMLRENGIKVPSDEDDERGEDNDAALYGMVYWELLDAVEHVLLDVAKRSKANEEIKPYNFSGEGIF